MRCWAAAIVFGCPPACVALGIVFIPRRVAKQDKRRYVVRNDALCFVHVGNILRRFVMIERVIKMRVAITGYGEPALAEAPIALVLKRRVKAVVEIVIRRWAD